jgi:hypothetical protein
MFVITHEERPKMKLNKVRCFHLATRKGGSVTSIMKQKKCNNIIATFKTEVKYTVEGP